VNLVVGATGFLGGTIARQLLSRGQPVRAFVRASSDKTEALSAAGAELAFGDLRDHRSFSAALEGVSSVIDTASAMSSQRPDDTLDSVDRDGQCALVDAVEARGGIKFVYVSSPSSDPSPLQAAKQAVEARLQASSLPFTIVRPSLITEVWLSPPLGFDYVAGRIRIYGSGENPNSWISLSDVSRVAVWAASARDAERKVYDVGGEAISPLDVVKIFEKVAGRRFECEKVPEAALREQYLSALDPRQRTFLAITLQCARGHRFDGRLEGTGAPEPIETVEAYARKVLARDS